LSADPSPPGAPATAAPSPAAEPARTGAPPPWRATAAIGPERRDQDGTAYRPVRYFARDGLLLAARDHGDPASTLTPLVCLPGLTRTVRDFEPLAARFADARRVVGFDLRGRGDSAWDPSPARYTPFVEADDVLAGLDALGIGRAILVGTSRGGLVSMVIAASRPDVIAGTVLNDIGPVIETSGLLRIKGIVGRDLAPTSWAVAEDVIRAAARDAFPALDDAGIRRMARRTFRDRDGRPERDYDPALAAGLAVLTPETPPIDLWAPFAALAARPVLALRGALSDLLSDATLAAMAERHGTVATHVVPDEAHAPLLDDAPTLDRVAAFLSAVDAGRA
jgi:pimeloyl-ACP methyl ester carboxylesterase